MWHTVLFYSTLICNLLYEIKCLPSRFCYSVAAPISKVSHLFLILDWKQLSSTLLLINQIHFNNNNNTRKIAAIRRNGAVLGTEYLNKNEEKHNLYILLSVNEMIYKKKSLWIIAKF